MGGIELPQLGEGRFQRSPHPPERNSLLLDDLIVENVEGSAMTGEIAGTWVMHSAARVACATFIGLPIAFSSVNVAFASLLRYEPASVKANRFMIVALSVPPAKGPRSPQSSANSN